MAIYTSLNASFGAATQASQGTPKTTGFAFGRMGESSIVPAQEVVDTGPEHYHGGGDRATAMRNIGMVIGKAGSFSGRCWAYPDMIGTIMVGSGLKDTVTGTDFKIHTLKIADRDEAKWLTLIHENGEGAAPSLFGNRAKDARVTRWRLASGRTGVGFSFQGVSIDVDPYVGTETGTEETNEVIIPSKGSMTLTIDGTSVSDEVLGTDLTFDNPVSLAETRLFNLTRADLPQAGISVVGSLVGIPISKALLDLLWFNDSGTVGRKIASGSLVYKHQSVNVIGATAQPYEIEVTINSARFALQPWGASGRSLLRSSIAFMMVDNVTDPIIVKITNGLAALA